MGEFKCKYMYYQEVGKKVICNIINCITLAIAATGDTKYNGSIKFKDTKCNGSVTI